VTLINLASAVLVVATAAVAPPAQTQRDTANTTSSNTQGQQTVKIRNDGNVQRPPENTDEQTRKAYDSFLDRVNKAYESAPDDENRWPNQPDRDRDGRKVEAPHS